MATSEYRERLNSFKKSFKAYYKDLNSKYLNLHKGITKVIEEIIVVHPDDVGSLKSEYQNIVDHCLYQICEYGLLYFQYMQSDKVHVKNKYTIYELSPIRVVFVSRTEDRSDNVLYSIAKTLNATVHSHNDTRAIFTISSLQYFHEAAKGISSYDVAAVIASTFKKDDIHLNVLKVVRSDLGPVVVPNSYKVIIDKRNNAKTDYDAEDITSYEETHGFFVFDKLVFDMKNSIYAVPLDEYFKSLYYANGDCLKMTGESY